MYEPESNIWICRKRGLKMMLDNKNVQKWPQSDVGERCRGLRVTSFFVYIPCQTPVGVFFCCHPATDLLSGQPQPSTYCTWLGESLSAASGGRRGEGRTARERWSRSVFRLSHTCWVFSFCSGCRSLSWSASVAMFYKNHPISFNQVSMYLAR